MEYMEGRSLKDKLQNHQPLTENSVSFLHRRKRYHSDIKPANILFSAEDNLKISDFGIADEVICDILSFSRRLSLYVSRTSD